MTGRISIYYLDLDYDARKKIWKTFLQKAEAQYSEDDLDKLAEYTINGRQVC